MPAPHGPETRHDGRWSGACHTRIIALRPSYIGRGGLAHGAPHNHTSPIFTSNLPLHDLSTTTSFYDPNDTMNTAGTGVNTGATGTAGTGYGASPPPARPLPS